MQGRGARREDGQGRKGGALTVVLVLYILNLDGVSFRGDGVALLADKVEQVIETGVGRCCSLCARCRRAQRSEGRTKDRVRVSRGAPRVWDKVCWCRRGGAHL